jgi:hypothetical protein
LTEQVKKLQILEEIENTLANITVTNNYATDIGVKLEYWATNDTEYETESLTFRDEEEEVSQQNELHEHYLKVEIEAIAFSNDPKSKGCYLLADILKAVGSNLNWGGNAIDTKLGVNSKAIATVGRTAVKVTVEIEVLYRTGMWET